MTYTLADDWPGCPCGHYESVHHPIRARCHGWAHPRVTWRGRVRLGRIRISLKCPCRRSPEDR